MYARLLSEGGYDLENNVMLSQPDFFNLGEGFDSFKWVSFVDSFKIAEIKKGLCLFL